MNHGSENRFNVNFCSYDLLYLTRTVHVITQIIFLMLATENGSVIHNQCTRTGRVVPPGSCNFSKNELRTIGFWEFF